MKVNDIGRRPILETGIPHNIGRAEHRGNSSLGHGDSGSFSICDRLGGRLRDNSLTGDSVGVGDVVGLRPDDRRDTRHYGRGDDLTVGIFGDEDSPGNGRGLCTRLIDRLCDARLLAGDGGSDGRFAALCAGEEASCVDIVLVHVTLGA